MRRASRTRSERPISTAAMAWVVAAACLLGGAPGALCTQLEGMGEDFLVSSLSGFLDTPSVAVADDGTMVVVWARLDACGPGCADSRTRVMGRRLSDQGSPLTDEFQITDSSGPGGTNPVVKAHPDGGFVVLWQADLDPVYPPVVRRLGLDGLPVGGPVTIRPRVAGESFGGNDTAFALDVFPDGEILVAWNSTWFFSLIEAQRFSPGLQTVGRRLVVNSHSGFLDSPSAAALGDDGFVVAWFRFAPFSAGESSVQVRRFTRRGAPVGVDVTASSEPERNRFYTHPVVSAREQGYTALWQVRRPGEFLGIRGRHFASDGTPVGREFRLDEQVAGRVVDQLTATADGEGRTLAVWTHNDHQQEAIDVVARVIDVDGRLRGPAARATATVSGNQYSPSLAVGPGGQIALAWTDESFGALERRIRGRLLRLVP